MRHASSLLFLGIASFGCGDDSSDPPSGPGGSLTAPVPMNPAGCSSPSVSPGDNPTLQIQHEGQTRNYILYVPKGIDPKTPTPVVVNWHGLTSNAIQEQALAGNAIADERKTIVAYPDGLGDPGFQSFNGGVCCSQAGRPAHNARTITRP